MNHRIKIPLLLVCLLLFAGSCKTVYKINSEKVKRISDRRIIRNVLANYLEYNTLSYKFNGEYADSGKTVSFNGNLRIRKDSLVWISVSVALGIELARIQVSRDSLYFMNKIKNEYYIRDVEHISGLFQVDMDYEILQSVLTNQIFLYADDDEQANSRREEVEDDEPDPGAYRKTFVADTDSNLYVLKTFRKRKLKKQIRKNRPEIIVQKFHVIPEIYKISNVNINDISEKRELNISYSDYMPIDSVMVPHTIRMDILENQKNISLTLSFSKITRNSDISFPFTIPEKYSLIEEKRK